MTQPEITKATPRPWITAEAPGQPGMLQIRGDPHGGNWTVGVLGEHDSRFVVLAVNAHNAMREALIDARMALGAAFSACEVAGHDRTIAKLNVVDEKIRAALAAAEGKVEAK